MAWERRRGQQFFYRSKRVNGYPQKVYVGNGADAVAQIEQLAQNRQRRQAEGEALRDEQERVFAAARTLEKLHTLTALLTRALLVAGGHYEHHGEWRQRHVWTGPECQG